MQATEEWETVTDYTTGHHARMRERRQATATGVRVALVFLVCLAAVLAAAFWHWNASTVFMLGLVLGYMLRLA